jgi:hypothetical protein
VPLIVRKATLTDDRPVFFDLAQLIYEPTLIIAGLCRARCLGFRNARRRFPPPWSIEELEACLVVKDSAGQKLAYVYFEEQPGGFNTRAMSRRRSSVSV